MHAYKFLSYLLSLILVFFANTQVANSALFDFSGQTDQTVIEHLRLHVSKKDKQAWLDAEEGSWEKWLANKSGFLGRKLFWDPQNEEATLMIGWESRGRWKSIPQEEINAIQEKFEELARKGTGIQVGNPFPLIFEGELIPQ